MVGRRFVSTGRQGRASNDGDGKGASGLVANPSATRHFTVVVPIRNTDPGARLQVPGVAPGRDAGIGQVTTVQRRILSEPLGSWYHLRSSTLEQFAGIVVTDQPVGSGAQGWTVTQHVAGGGWPAPCLHSEDGGELMCSLTTWYSVGP